MQSNSNWLEIVLSTIAGIARSAAALMTVSLLLVGCGQSYKSPLEPGETLSQNSQVTIDGNAIENAKVKKLYLNSSGQTVAEFSTGSEQLRRGTIRVPNSGKIDLRTDNASHEVLPSGATIPVASQVSYLTQQFSGKAWALLGIAAVVAAFALRRFLAFRAIQPLIPILMAIGLAAMMAYAGHDFVVPWIKEVQAKAKVSADAVSEEPSAPKVEAAWAQKFLHAEKDFLTLIRSPRSANLIAFVTVFLAALPFTVILLCWAYRKLSCVAICGLLLMVGAETRAMASDATAGTKVDAYYLLIDVSASMNEVPKPPAVPLAWSVSKLEEVKRQLAELCNKLPTEAAVRVFVFDEGSPRVGPRLDLLGSDERTTLRTFFATLRAEGRRTYAWRSLDSILDAAANELATSDRTAAVRILTYTDGEDNDPSRPQLEQVLEKHRDLLREKNGAVQVHYMTLGFSLSAEIQKAFADFGVQAAPTLSPEEIIPLIANFSWNPVHPEVGDEVVFIDHSMGMISGYSWSIDTRQITAKAPAHRFSNHGIHPVRLTITSPSGRSKQIEKVVNVLPPPELKAAFEVFPREIKPSDPVQFRSKTSGPVTKYAWDFGDGSHSPVRDAAHSYTAPGSYSVILRVSGAKGQTAVTTNEIVVMPFPRPLAAFEGGSDRVVLGKPVKFFNRSRGPIDRAEWIILDEQNRSGVPESDRKTDVLTHTFKSAGEHTVRLVVTGPGGRHETVQRVIVEPPPAPPMIPPTARFDVDIIKGSVPLAVRFRNLSEGAFSVLELDFGDGTPPFVTTTFVSCTHTYKAHGRFTPVLRAEGGDSKLHSIFSMPATPICVQPAPSWILRNWWWVGLALAAIVITGIGAQPIVARRAWAARHARLKGFIHWKPVEPKSSAWKSVKIAGENGHFAHKITTDELQSAAPLAMTLRKRLEPAKRREIYTIDFLRNDDVVASTVLEPGKEKQLAGPGIVIRYDF